MYHIYPKYSDALTPYHTCPKILNKFIIPPAEASKNLE